MKRGLFTILATLSLLLFVAVCVLWVRSYRVADWLTRYGGESDWLLINAPGCIAITRRPFGESGPPQLFSKEWRWYVSSGPEHGYTSANRSFERWRVLGVTWLSRHGAELSWQQLLVPHWLPAAAALLLPIVWGFRYRRWRLERHEPKVVRCTSCGYDLRATPERCPECGEPAR